MIAGAERLGQAIFGRRREKAAADEVQELPEMWRYWHDTKALVEGRDAESDGASGASPAAKQSKQQAA